MAVIPVVAVEVDLTYPGQRSEVYDIIAGATITSGQLIYQDANGRAALAAGGVAGTADCIGVALTGGGIGQSISYCKRGFVEGFSITQAYDAPVFVSNTPGALDDAAGTVSRIVGRIMPLADEDRTKIAYFDINLNQ